RQTRGGSGSHSLLHLLRQLIGGRVDDVLQGLGRVSDGLVERLVERWLSHHDQAASLALSSTAAPCNSSYGSNAKSSPKKSGITRTIGRAIRLTMCGLPFSLSTIAASNVPMRSSLWSCSMASRSALA